jgi:hypothetical protein
MPKENYDKLWLQRSLNDNAIKRAQEAIQGTGRALPCKVTAVNGSTVTVSFLVSSKIWNLPSITIPKAEDSWVRSPTQIGDMGYTVPGDCYLGGVSGLGGGTADLRKRANLSALVFHPVSNSNSPPIDPNAAQVQGPNGVILKTTEGTASSIVVSQTGITLTFGSTTVTLNATGVLINGNLIDTGNISATGTITPGA